jgi:hypothetical protein
MLNLRQTVVLLASVLLCFVPARGATLPTTIKGVSSEFTSIDRGAIHCVDGSGLDANNPPNHTTNPNGFMWLNTGDGFFGGGADPHPGGDLAQITFDLGGLSTVDSFRVWNYNEVNANSAQSFTDRGVQTLTISIATSASGPYVPLLNPAGTSTTWTFNIAPGSNIYTGQLFTLTTPIQAAFIRFDILTNYDTAGTDHGLVGLSEVQFYGSTVPEPGTLSLIAVGVSGLVTLRRRIS